MILRRFTNDAALPGGMVEMSDDLSKTLTSEFADEAGSKPRVLDKIRQTLGNERDLEAEWQLRNSIVKGLFEEATGSSNAMNDRTVYKGYVDDPRNTDNAWMETTMLHIHSKNIDKGGNIVLGGGDDAGSADWMDLPNVDLTQIQSLPLAEDAYPMEWGELNCRFDIPNGTSLKPMFANHKALIFELVKRFQTLDPSHVLVRDDPLYVEYKEAVSASWLAGEGETWAWDGASARHVGPNPMHLLRQQRQEEGEKTIGTA
jgi:ADP-ribose pyrophosphatase YjhB (NUDIX family)